MDKHLRGVYYFENLANGKIYFGSGIIKKRLQEHIRALNSGTHKNPHWQNAWNKYGSDSFIFHVLDVCDPQDCRSGESLWIDEFGTKDPNKGYNKHDPLDTSRGLTLTSDHKAKISSTMKCRKPSPQMVETNRIRMTGMVFSKETCYKIALAKAKPHVVISPEGKEFIVSNLKTFCLNHGLHQGNMSAIANGGGSKSYKGWSCRHLLVGE